MVKSNSFFEKSKNLSLVGIGNIISNSISSLFWIFIASILSTEEYGELGFLLAIVSTISAFALIGSNNVLTVYVAKKIKIQATIFLIALITGFISSIGLLIFTENIFISFYPLGVIVFSLIIYDFLGKKLFLNYAKYMILQRVIMVGLSVIFLETYGVNGIILGYTISLLCFGVFIYKGFKESRIEFRLLRERKNFIINNFGTHVLEVLSINIDKLIIFPFLGATILGPYQLGFQIFAALTILPNIVTQYTLPNDASGISSNKLKKITILISIILIIITILFSPILLPNFFPDFESSVEIVQIMSLAILPTTISLVITSELLGNEKTKSVIIGMFVSIITLTIGIFSMGEIFGFVGLGASLVLAKTLQCITLIILKYRK